MLYFSRWRECEIFIIKFSTECYKFPGFIVNTLSAKPIVVIITGFYFFFPPWIQNGQSIATNILAIVTISFYKVNGAICFVESTKTAFRAHLQTIGAVRNVRSSLLGRTMHWIYIFQSCTAASISYPGGTQRVGDGAAILEDWRLNMPSFGNGIPSISSILISCWHASVSCFSCNRLKQLHTTSIILMMWWRTFRGYLIITYIFMNECNITCLYIWCFDYIYEKMRSYWLCAMTL